ncbi:unnamed protein product [Phyllotreta striolata]|uniref:Inner centromere protein ARK-binding domain-containing protein n=1 Tax=Phyllotreta striolata TaxID=444603 RepID=A0A9N9XJ81_PHYSR|nr:unnamed protein product [Phyllotreta striolata]
MSQMFDIFEDLKKETENLQVKLNELSLQEDSEYNKFFNKLERFFNYVDTRNVEYLDDEFQYLKNFDSAKENREPSTDNESIKSQRTRNTNAEKPIKIKQEKISIASAISTSTGSKTDDAEEMPAPKLVPKKKKKPQIKMEETFTRTTRSKVRTNQEPAPEIKTDRCSDVVIQDTTITHIDITGDSEVPLPKNVLNVPKASKPVNSPIVRVTRSKVKSKQSANITAQTVYEDAQSNLPNENEAVQQNDATMIIENPVIKPGDVPSEPTILKNYPKSPARIKSKKDQIREIFSPFEKTTTKKKIEAFENLGTCKTPQSATKIPISKQKIYPASATKYNTPTSNKFMPKNCSTTKTDRALPGSSSFLESGLSMKALQTSQAEFREIEKRRQQKEMEALRKKEAMILAAAEEKKRKREEKLLKVQQQKELLEKEQQYKLEKQRLKEEKHKLAMAEKEKCRMKSKEELEKKRMLIKEKAKATKEIPIYLTTKIPPLPTADCYDSDDEKYVKKSKYYLPWCESNTLYNQLLRQHYGIKSRRKLMQCVNQTPNLLEIFEDIDPKKMKRKSSAEWKVPPRYTLFSTTRDTHFSEDSEGESNGTCR